MATFEVKLDKKTILLGAGGIVALGGLIFGGVALAGALAPKAASFDLFDDVRSSCGSEGIDVTDGGHTLAVDMMGEDDWSGATYDAVECAVSGAEVPSFIKTNMWETTALSGRQSDSYEVVLGGEGTDYAETVFAVEVQWSYHPDSGLGISFNAEEVTDGNVQK